MTLKRLTPPQTVILSLLINAALFGGIFSLGLFGVSMGSILFILAAAVSLEVIYIAISIHTSINKYSQSLGIIESHFENIKEDEEKARTALIYIGHQIRAMQHELDALKKGHVIKSNAHTHHPKAHS